MKSWRILVCLLSLTFFVMAGPACQQAGGPQKIELRGAIQKESEGSGLYVRSGGKQYHIVSSQDLSAMIGKMVSIEGTVAEADGKLTISISSVVEK